MTNIIDYILSEVSLDDRVNGIFLMENNIHMDVLREYLIEHGIPRDEVLEMTNKMVEGNYPLKQAYQKDTGQLITWPSPEYKAKAFKENPGKYTDQDPNPKKDVPVEPTEKPIQNTEEPSAAPLKQEPIPTEKTPNIFEPQQSLKVEPINQQQSPTQQAQPIQPLPKTPQAIAAEKEYINQIFDTDNNNLSNLTPTLAEQLKVLYKNADELGLREAVTFLTKYVKP
jgi:hypothetical protein